MENLLLLSREIKFPTFEDWDT